MLTPLSFDAASSHFLRFSGSRTVILLIIASVLVLCNWQHIAVYLRSLCCCHTAVNTRMMIYLNDWHKIAAMKTQRITLRIPDELHEALMKEGDRMGRSMNAEVIYRLMESFSIGASEDTDDRIEQIARRIFHEEVQRMGLTKEAQDQ